MAEEPTSMILRLHHAQITVPEGTEAEARGFYCGLLGLPEVPKPESLAGRGGFWVQVGGQQVHVGAEPNFDRLLTKAHLAYEVDDLARWRQRLADAGIKALEGTPIPGYDRFECRDPCGNRVEFIQDVSRNDPWDPTPVL